MIIERTCPYCSKVIRVNGDEKFRDTMESHLKNNHPSMFSFMVSAKNDANEELTELINKYPELTFQINYFDIDYYNLEKNENKN